MKCSKCGYERQTRDDAFVPIGECPACGVVYAKHDPTKGHDTSANGIRPSHLKPSPVDAISLRKARERVDKRLRERGGTRARDDRHEQTLKLAKRLTSEQIRRRHDEWKQAHADKLTPPEKSANSDQTQEASALSKDKTPPSQSPLRKDHLTIGPSQSEVEKLTPVEATGLENVDPLPQVAEKSSEPADKTESLVPASSSADEEPILLNDTVIDMADQSSIAMRAQPPQNMEANRQDISEALPEPEFRIPAVHIASSALKQKYKIGLPRLLPVVAWLILCAGVIGAFLSWTTIGDVEAGVRIPIPESLSTLPLGLLLGFTYLATGVLGFAFFWVSSLISIQLKDIRQLLIAEDRGRNATHDEEIEQ